MKYKKCIFLLLLIMILGWNKVYAANQAVCYYQGTDMKAYVTFTKNGALISGGVQLIKYDGKVDSSKGTVRNIGSDWRPNIFKGVYYTSKTIDIDAINSDYMNCPSSIEVGKFNKATAISRIDPPITGCTANGAFALGGLCGYRVSPEEFWGPRECTGSCIVGEDVRITCDNYELFGNPTYAGIKADGTYIDPPSPAYIINKILTIIRIAVPIMLIALGVVDISRAVIASKEDEMRKAQQTFLKRIIAGIAVFFAPVIVNVMMNLADLAWTSSDGDQTYEVCRLEQIIK